MGSVVGVGRWDGGRVDNTFNTLQWGRGVGGRSPQGIVFLHEERPVP